MCDPFAPCTLAGVPLRNRFVRSATAGPYAPAGRITEAGLNRYRALAERQAGLIITEMIHVSPGGNASRSTMALCGEEDAAQHRRVTQSVHEAGGAVFAQLNHGGAASLTERPLSPSGIPSPYTNQPAEVMTEADIRSITLDFARAAARAKGAGYDGVQIHCAHGYLLSQFIDPCFNRRTDRYGGPVENRFRFVSEVLTAVREAVGADYPVCVKINCNTTQDDQAYEADLLWMGKACARLGVCAIEVSGCDFTPRGRRGEHNYYLDRAVKLRQASGLPVMLVGGIRSRADIETVLAAGVDFVSMSRPFLCQPDLVEKLAAGEDSACVSCSKCFIMSRKFSEEGRLCIRRDPGADREGSL